MLLLNMSSCLNFVVSYQEEKKRKKEKSAWEYDHNYSMMFRGRFAQPLLNDLYGLHLHTYCELLYHILLVISFFRIHTVWHPPPLERSTCVQPFCAPHNNRPATPLLLLMSYSQPFSLPNIQCCQSITNSHGYIANKRLLHNQSHSLRRKHT